MSERVAVIVGASQGVGFETARRLAERGLTVLITDPDGLIGKAAADKLQSEGLSVFFHPLDLQRQDSIIRLRQWLAANTGRLDILVNNSPGPEPAADEDILNADMASLRDSMESSALAGLRLAQEFIPLMQEGGWGRIVNVGTGAGRMSLMGDDAAAYRLAQAGLYAVTAMLGAAMGDGTIRVNAVDASLGHPSHTNPGSAASTEQTADDIISAIFVADDGPTGRLLRDGEVIVW